MVTGPRQAALRQVRTCFDHLAGVLAVAITDRMVARGHLELAADGRRARLGEYPDSGTITTHLFQPVAVPGICVA